MPFPVYHQSDLSDRMDHISDTYQTLNHTRENQPAVSNQHKNRGRNNYGHQQGCLRWYERLWCNHTASLCLGTLCILLLGGTITHYALHYLGKGQLESIQNLTLQRDNLLKGLSEADSKIQMGWWYYNFSVYYPSEWTEMMSWTDSRQYCKTKRADLVIINSSEEQMFIEKLTKTHNMDVWIGLTNRDTGVLQWVDGFPLSQSFWSPGKPLNQGSELCVQIRTKSLSIKGKSWNSCHCGQYSNFICEKKIFQ